jgi:hypothetical protein
MSDISSSNIISFIITVIIITVITLGYFAIGAAVLYACKLAQSNILPTDSNCFPYTNNKPAIDSILTNIFVTFTDPKLSQKLAFPYNDWNSKNMIIDLFREYKTEARSGFLINYFISIIVGLLSFNYYIVNIVLSMINLAPEPLVLLIGPVVAFLLFMFMFIVNMIYMIYLWFANMNWFFTTNINMDDNHGPIWKIITLWEPFNYLLGFGLTIGFIILFFILLFVAWPILPFLSAVWTLISALGYESEKDGKKYSLLTVITNVFKYYKVTITATISILIVLSTFAHMGVLYGVAAIITLLLINFGIVSTTLFKPIHPDSLTPLVSDAQASKKCVIPAAPPQKPRSWFMWLFRGGRSSINRDIKKINAKMNR